MTLALVLLMGICASAQEGDGMLRRSKEYQKTYRNDGQNRQGIGLVLPNFGENGDEDAQGPLGSGIAMLTLLGAAYAWGRKRCKE